MNPAWGLFAGAGLVAAAIFLRARPGTARRASSLAALAAIVALAWFFRAPLSLESGVPSPSAALAAVAPWPPSGPTSGGNPQLRDVTFQIEPWLLFTRRTVRSGALPLWNPHQFAGSAFWANGQSAPLFPLHLLFAALPVQLGLMILPCLRLLVAGAGVWCLARALGRSPIASFSAATAFGLSGMVVSFALFPMGNALALVPWVFLATERLARGVGGVAGIAVTTGLQLLAGHPETALHTALLSGIYLVVRSGRGVASWSVAGRWLGGWILGAGVAAAQIVPFACLLPETVRWQLPGDGAAPPFSLLLELPLRLVLPELYGHPALGTWRGPFNYSATAVYLGALALPLAAAGLALCRPGREDRRPWRALLVVLAFSFLAAYHWPGVRDLLAALPIVGRALPHRLLFGVELGLSLFIAAGVDEVRAGRGRGVLAGAPAALGMLLAGWILRGEDWMNQGLVRRQLAWTVGVAGLALLLVLALRLPASARRRAAWVLPVLLTLDLAWSHGAILGRLPAERIFPPTGAIDFLADAEERIAALDSALRPNAAMAYGLHDVRGDDPMKLASYELGYRQAAPAADAVESLAFRPVTRWQAPWLDRLGVRWVMASPLAEPPPGWRLAYQGPDAHVFERPVADPLAGSRRPGGWSLVVEGDSGRRRVAESWAPGWRALVDGSPSTLGAARDGAGMEVGVPAGRHRVEVLYRPAGLLAGLAVTAAACAWLATLLGPIGESRAPA